MHNSSSKIVPAVVNDATELLSKAFDMISCKDRNTSMAVVKPMDKDSQAVKHMQTVSTGHFGTSGYSQMSAF